MRQVHQPLRRDVPAVPRDEQPQRHDRQHARRVHVFGEVKEQMRRDEDDGRLDDLVIDDEVRPQVHKEAAENAEGRAHEQNDGFG